MIQRIKDYVYLYGFYTGLILIALPIAWDMFWKGGGDLNMVSISVKGVIIQIIGVVLLINGGRDSR